MNEQEHEPEPEIEVFYDGACPLCVREIRMLMRRDRRCRVLFSDIAAPAFDPSSTGRSHAELMARIHGRLPDGTIIEGVEVFRRLYHAVGFRRLVAISRWPVLSALLDRLYGLFARNRLRLTGRCHATAARRRARPRRSGRRRHQRCRCGRRPTAERAPQRSRGFLRTMPAFR